MFSYHKVMILEKHILYVSHHEAFKELTSGVKSQACSYFWKHSGLLTGNNYPNFPNSGLASFPFFLMSDDGGDALRLLMFHIKILSFALAGMNSHSPSLLESSTPLLCSQHLSLEPSHSPSLQSYRPLFPQALSGSHQLSSPSFQSFCVPSHLSWLSSLD